MNDGFFEAVIRINEWLTSAMRTKGALALTNISTQE